MNAQARTPRLTQLIALTLALGGSAAMAQSAGHSYFDFKLGQSSFDTNCGNFYRCDNSDTSFGITYGQDIDRHLGVEFGYTDYGSATRGGGDLKASAANASLVARLPLNQLSLFGKVGLAYGWTDSRPANFSDVSAGKDSGFGPQIGLGVAVDLNKTTAVVLQWEQSQLPFAGESSRAVDNTSVGLRLKF